MPTVKFVKAISVPARIRRDKTKNQYKKNLRSVSAPTTISPVAETNVKVKGMVTEEGHTIAGEVIGRNTLNRRLNGIADYDVTYKVLMLGDSGVGKTAVVEHLDGRPFTPKHMTTVGKSFSFYYLIERENFEE